MPVRKYRDVSEMPDPWHEPGSPQLWDAVREVWDLAERIHQPSYPPGVYKHRSMESLQRQRKRWDRANFEAYRQRLEDRRPG